MFCLSFMMEVYAQNSFVCGLFNDSCTSGNTLTMDAVQGSTIVLRPYQVESGSDTQRSIEPTTTFTAAAVAVENDNKDETVFTAAEIAGVGAGVGVPLLAGLVALVFIIFNQRKKIRALKAAQTSHKEDPGYSATV